MGNRKFQILLSIYLVLLASFFIYGERFLNLEKSKKIDGSLEFNSHSGGGYIMNTTADYSWIDITSTGTILPGVSDWSHSYNYIDFPTWNFTFYETEYNRIEVGSSGWTSFSPTSTHSYPGTIPDYKDQNFDCVALLWDNFQPSESSGGGGTVYYQFLTSPNRLIIEYHEMYTNNWDSLPEYAGTFEVIFYESGEIKFQYQNVHNLTYETAVVGLDHGDGINYNIYTEIESDNLPLYSKAIEFTFDKMTLINYTIDNKVNDEVSWIVEKINNEKMDTFFGMYWENDFGLFEDPKRGEKMKIKINSIIDNDTNLRLDYDMWDWIYRLNDFSISPDGVDSVYYFKNITLNNPNYTLPNFFPLILPTPSYLYLRYSDLSSNYSSVSYNSYYQEISLDIYQTKYIDGHNLNVYGSGTYNINGTLEYISFSMYNESESQYEKIFEISLLTQIHLIQYKLNVIENEEYSWILTKINQDKMILFFGNNWENKFGLFPDPLKSQKMKVKISSITQNTTHWGIEYGIWDWINRFDVFNLNADNIDKLYHRIDPFNYTKLHNMSNIFPFFVPTPPEQYFRFGYLDHYTYDLIYSFHTDIYYPELGYSDYKNINGSGLNFHGRAFYNSKGVLEKLNFKLYNGSQIETVFELEYLTLRHLLNGSIQLKLNEERSWLLTKINETVMESFFGNDWETKFGLPQIKNNFEKIKINITFILENSTHLKINYSMWDWTNLYDEFISTPSTFDYVEFDKNPFNYTLPYNSTSVFPLFMPYPNDLYWKYGYIDENFYQEIQYIPYLNVTTLNFRISNPSNELYGTAVYNVMGVLSEMHINFYDDTLMKSYQVLNLLELNEGIKPDYIGINVGDVYEYEINKYDIDTNFVGSEIPSYKKAKIEIKYISGEDTALNKVIVIGNATYLNESEEWIKQSENDEYYYQLFYQFMDIHFIHENFSDIFNWDQFKFPVFINKDINWTDHFDAFNNSLSSIDSDINIEFKLLNNGFEIIQEYESEIIEHFYLYTKDGVLNITSFLSNGEEFFSCQLINCILTDVTAPNITINSPTNNSEFMNIAPSFNLTIIDDNLESIWYTLDGGLANISCSISGQINQNIWDNQLEGEILIAFYANDSSGNIGTNSITVIKQIPSSTAILGYNISIIYGMIFVFILILIKIQKKKKKMEYLTLQVR
ncbi:MAG: hypothetical protein ACFFDH_15800 [Promethearchaeota archaeon]